MKIACLIHGEPRLYREFDSILTGLKGADSIDWYFYLWQDNNGNPAWAQDSSSKWRDHMVGSRWKTVDQAAAQEFIKHNLEPPNKLAGLLLGDKHTVEEFVNPSARPTIHLMYYSMQQVYKMINNEYDLVIKARGDVHLQQPIELDTVLTRLNSASNVILMPNNGHYGEHRINDQFAIGKMPVMEIYCGLYEELHNLKSNGCQWHPETLLGTHLKNNGIECQPGEFGIDLRATGTVVDGAYIPDFGRWN